MPYIRQVVRVDGRDKTGWTPKSGGRPPARATWEVVVSLGRDSTGRYRQHSKRLIGTYTAAKDAAFRMETAARSGRADASTVTVGQLVDRYIEHRRAIGRAPKTLVGYETIARRLRLALGDVKAFRLSAADLDGYYADLLADGLGPATVHHHHAFIAQVLNQGAKWDLVTVPHAADRASPPSLEQPEPRSPTPQVADRLIRAFREEHPQMAALVYLAAVTGCRRGEVCGWRWSYFDLEAGQLRVRASISDAAGRVVEKSTKTKRPRVMALDIRVVAVVLALWEQYVRDCEVLGCEPERESYVFSQAPDHWEPWRPDRVTHTFGRLRARQAEKARRAVLAGGGTVSEADAARDEVLAVRLKDFRQFSATQLLGGGVDVRTAAARMGHDAAVMLRHYAGVIPANDQAAAELLAGVLESPLRPG